MILFGEHAVGCGRPAIVTPIGRGLTLTTALRGRGRCDAAIRVGA
ncbi:hypothetical protein [Kitasatospora sp. NPDC015120]